MHHFITQWPRPAQPLARRGHMNRTQSIKFVQNATLSVLHALQDHGQIVSHVILQITSTNIIGVYRKHAHLHAQRLAFCSILVTLIALLAMLLAKHALEVPQVQIVIVAILQD